MANAKALVARMRNTCAIFVWVKMQSATPIGINATADSVSTTAITIAKLIVRSLSGHVISVFSGQRAAQRKYRIGLDWTEHPRLASQPHARAHRQMVAQRQFLFEAHRREVVLAVGDLDAAGCA